MIIAEKKEVLLSVEGVNLSFKDPETYKVKKVLSDINLEIRNIVRPDITQGQVISLVGESGIGKTQLFMLLAGLNKPDSGKILIGADQHKVKSGDVGIVTQDYFLFPWRKIKNTLLIAARQNKSLKSRKEIDELIKEYSVSLSIDKFMDVYPSELSGGQRQRVCVVQQLLRGSDYLLMDEPFSGQDFKRINKTLDMILKISQVNESKTIMIISHDIIHSAAVSDTIFLLSNKNRGDDGATIIREIDLIKIGLAWEPDIKRKPEFMSLINEIESTI